MIEPAIETERLLLRLPRAEDAAELGAIYVDEETMRFVGGTIAQSEMARQIESMRARWEESGFGTLVAEKRDDGRVVGDFGIYVWQKDTWDVTRDLSVPHEIELGWLLGLAYRGEGYATEAALALRDWALIELSPPRLISLISVDNTASQAVARRLGCTCERSVETARFGIAEIWVHP